MFSRFLQLAMLTGLSLLISACSLLKPYQAELKQGNFIRPEQIEQLAIGQTSEQVTFLLGTPMVTGERPAQRWVYPTHTDANGYDTLVIEFENGLVSDFVQK